MQAEPHYPLPFLPYVAPVKRKDSALMVIALVVVLLHFLGIGLNMMTSISPEKKVIRQQVVVKTVQLNQHKFEPVAAPSMDRVPLPVPVPVPAVPVVVPVVPVIEMIAPPPQIIEQPKPIEKIPDKVVTPKKVEIKKVETKPAPPKAVKIEAQKTTPAKKPVSPAPVKKAETAPKPKPEIDKKALEAEKAKQQALAAAQEAAKMKQQQIAAAEEVARQKQQQLLSQAKESFAKMGETRDKISLTPSVNLSDTSIPQRIQNLQIDALPAIGGVALGSQEIKYQDGLGARLKKDLILPDYGTVKVKLTLAKSGKVAKIEVTSTSDKNKKYIEKTLPTLIFSPFGTQFDGAEQYTFMLTLHNDE